jgi:hypothetical protein
MSIVGLWSSVSTRQSAMFSAAGTDTAILALGCVARPLWTASPRRTWRLSGSQNRQCRDHVIYEFTP